MTQKQAEFYRREIAAQRQWMAQCGGSMAGYVARYGSRNDPEHAGDGGEMIYAADAAQVAYMTARMRGQRVTYRQVYAEVCQQIGVAR